MVGTIKEDPGDREQSTPGPLTQTCPPPDALGRIRTHPQETQDSVVNPGTSNDKVLFLASRPDTVVRVTRLTNRPGPDLLFTKLISYCLASHVGVLTQTAQAGHVALRMAALE